MLRRKSNALLLLGDILRLLIALLIKRCNCLPKSKVLLPLQLSALQARPLPAKCPAPNSLRLLLRKLLALLLLQSLHSRVDHSLRIRVHILVCLKLAGVCATRPCQCQASGSPIIRLR